MSRAEFSVVMNGRMPSLFASHASAKSRVATARSSAVHASRPARLGGMSNRYASMLGGVEARHRGRLADAAGIEADHVELLLQRARRRRSRASRGRSRRRCARAAGVRQQRPDRFAARRRAAGSTESSISPADGSAQSSGAVTVVHSNRRRSRSQSSVCS